MGGWGSNLEGGRANIVGVVMKGGHEGMNRRGKGTRVRGSTHVCGSVSSVVPDVVHQGGEMLQAVGDVVRKEQDAHRLRTQTQSRGSNKLSALIWTSVVTHCDAHDTCGHVSM